jgi:3-isopropylmalate/(R)-2-methylmalate dehydratase large subunit
MGYTIAEKVLARCSGSAAVRAGQAVAAAPDFVLAYELKGTTDVIERDLVTFAAGRVHRPERVVMFIDHRVPPKTPDQEAFHEETRAWSRREGFQLFDREGIGHQVATEKGYAIPGAFAVHADGHVSQMGAFGVLAMGLRGNVFEAWAGDTVTLTVPHTTRIELQGRLRPGVMGRDVLHRLIHEYGSEFAAFDVIEFGGRGAGTLTVEDRQAICGQTMFTGALSSVFEPTPALCASVPAPLSGYGHVVLQMPDGDAAYRQRLVLDLDTVEPMLAAPPDPGNIIPVGQVLGLGVQAAYLGSCASGRLEDLQVAAAILQGRQVAPGVSMNIVPSSQQVMRAAADNGILGTLIAAGAFVSSPSCDFCSGNIATMAPGQRAVSTGTLNVPGRMGAVEAEIYLGSPAFVAASALEGRIVDPRDYAHWLAGVRHA